MQNPAAFDIVCGLCVTGLVVLQGPSLQMIRRHARSSQQMHYGPAVQTVTGNWVAGMHKGVIGGVDYGSTGVVSLILHTVLQLAHKLIALSSAGTSLQLATNTSVSMLGLQACSAAAAVPKVMSKPRACYGQWLHTCIQHMH